MGGGFYQRDPSESKTLSFAPVVEQLSFRVGGSQADLYSSLTPNKRLLYLDHRGHKKIGGGPEHPPLRRRIQRGTKRDFPTDRTIFANFIIQKQFFQNFGPVATPKIIDLKKCSWHYATVLCYWRLFYFLRERFEIVC